MGIASIEGAYSRRVADDSDDVQENSRAGSPPDSQFVLEALALPDNDAQSMVGTCERGFQGLVGRIR